MIIGRRVCENHSIFLHDIFFIITENGFFCACEAFNSSSFSFLSLSFRYYCFLSSFCCFFVLACSSFFLFSSSFLIISMDAALRAGFPLVDEFPFSCCFSCGFSCDFVSVWFYLLCFRPFECFCLLSV